MLDGIIRESIGKKASKALKRDGYLIANIYGKGLDNIHAAFNLNEFIKEVRKKDSLAFEVKVAGKVYKVVVVDYQKDPITSTLEHVDLKVVLDDVYSKYLIPVKITGTPIGLKNKGVLIKYRKRIAVKCKGSNLPNSFTLDVTSLDIDDHILIRDLKALDGVTLIEAGELPVVGVTKAN